MMRAVKDEKNDAWDRMNDRTKRACDIYGPLLLRNGNPVLRRFLVREHRQLTQLLQRLAAQQETDTIRKRMSEVRDELQFNESAYTILGAIKDAGI
jgi:tRNA (adenine22-N1)-methyltransferase